MSLKRVFGAALAVGLTASLAACGGSSSFEEGEASKPAEDAIVIGSSNYYSNEIIAEIYAQALEAEGFTVKRDFKIGAREVLNKEMEDGSIDVRPEYTGPLLQFWNPDNQVTGKDAIY